MLSFGFYNSVDGDRKYFAEQFGAIFDGLIKDGIFATIGNAFNVTAGTGLQVVIDTGKAWFNHTWTVNEAPMTADLSEADIYFPRTDAIVLEINQSAAVRANSIKVIQGSPGSSAPRPPLTKDDANKIWQYPLAYIRVEKNATSLDATKIEKVIGQEPCPFVTGILETIDITTLMEKWDEDYSQWSDEKEQQFTTWFENVKAQLTDDVVTNLQKEIDEKLNIKDKATEEEAKAGAIDNKYVTPKTMAAATEETLKKKKYQSQVSLAYEAGTGGLQDTDATLFPYGSVVDNSVFGEEIPEEYKTLFAKSTEYVQPFDGWQGNGELMWNSIYNNACINYTLPTCPLEKWFETETFEVYIQKSTFTGSKQDEKTIPNTIFVIRQKNKAIISSEKYRNVISNNNIVVNNANATSKKNPLTLAINMTTNAAPITLNKVNIPFIKLHNDTVYMVALFSNNSKGHPSSAVFYKVTKNDMTSAADALIKGDFNTKLTPKLISQVNSTHNVWDGHDSGILHKVAKYDNNKYVIVSYFIRTDISSGAPYIRVDLDTETMYVTEIDNKLTSYTYLSLIDGDCYNGMTWWITKLHNEGISNSTVSTCHILKIDPQNVTISDIHSWPLYDNSTIPVKPEWLYMHGRNMIAVFNNVTIKLKENITNPQFFDGAQIAIYDVGDVVEGDLKPTKLIKWPGLELVHNISQSTAGDVCTLSYTIAETVQSIFIREHGIFMNSYFMYDAKNDKFYPFCNLTSNTINNQIDYGLTIGDIRYPARHDRTILDAFKGFKSCINTSFNDLYIRFSGVPFPSLSININNLNLPSVLYYDEKNHVALICTDMNNTKNTNFMFNYQSTYQTAVNIDAKADEAKPNLYNVGSYAPSLYNADLIDRSKISFMQSCGTSAFNGRNMLLVAIDLCTNTFTFLNIPSLSTYYVSSSSYDDSSSAYFVKDGNKIKIYSPSGGGMINMLTTIDPDKRVLAPPGVFDIDHTYIRIVPEEE